MTALTMAPAVSGMGAIPCDNGVNFRVWAPNAERVCVIGSFNNWDKSADIMQAEANGNWSLLIERATIGDEYKFVVTYQDRTLERIDPYAREVTNSAGNGIVHDPHFDWGADEARMPPWNEIVIYEMHVGTFNPDAQGRPGTFESAVRRFPYLRSLGVNVIQLMPVAEFAGDFSWGYNPSNIFAVESIYGGSLGLKTFVRKAHECGFSVIMDVVYNHFGPGDLSLWQFDGWNEHGKGGIYFYNDYRSSTPWGESRPDYGRGEVRQFIYDNARMWIEEYHIDGLRYDMTAYIRTVDGVGNDSIAEGWSLMQWINRDLARDFPGTLLIAEDLQNNEYLTKPVEEGGAGFSTQWDASFVHPVRAVVEQIQDSDRSLQAICDALLFQYNGDVFQRVVYSESHDEVANGKARVPQQIDPENPTSVYAQKRSVLAAVLTLTAPGIPMLFQGQEFLTDKWFQDTDPLDWNRAAEFRGLTRLYHDLIELRLNRRGKSKGLTGQKTRILHFNDFDKVIAFQRSADGGVSDDVVVVMNFSGRSLPNYEMNFACTGQWRLRFNSDWTGYSKAFSNVEAPDSLLVANASCGVQLELAPYSALIYCLEEGSAT